ncbi:hypothetical protein DPMN_122639 [Dreissena polymorpha]|uniref:Uncharacterized protein n=1 Tax=Dreissena polymorpha TaxID=45954 RepID=A0A9D4GLW6_DREPO|nr:hypothetical protein DPMN_121333 [Dreissena polymorpha]KAH3820890.1 hypothetical protein DPMN_122639 [Dreissena polymorpha]
MELAVVDSRTYMYYIQYVSFQLTGTFTGKHSAFKNLQDHVVSDIEMVFPTTFVHIETSLHLLGHCCELEGELSRAWQCYKLSLGVQPQNNAAYWHIFRLIEWLITGP